MTRAHFAEGQVLFREGDPADRVFRLLSGTVHILRKLDGDPILLGTVGAGQFIGEMGVVENRPRNARNTAASIQARQMMRIGFWRLALFSAAPGPTQPRAPA